MTFSSSPPRAEPPQAAKGPWTTQDTGRRSSRVTAGAGEPPAAPGPSVGWKARLTSKGGVWVRGA